MRVDEERYNRSGRPRIEQADIQGGDSIVVTVDAVEEEKTPEGKLLLVFTTEEFGDKVQRLNKTQTRYMVEKLGDETDSWIGAKVPLVKKVEQFGEGKRIKDYDVVWVAAPEEWETIIRAAGGGKPAKKGRGRK